MRLINNKIFCLYRENALKVINIIIKRISIYFVYDNYKISEGITSLLIYI